MPDGLEIRVDIKELTAALEKRVRALNNPEPLGDKIGMIVTREVKATFKAGGRPQKWPPSKRALKDQGQTLMDTKNLSRSIHHEIVAARSGFVHVAIGTNVEYALAMQFGMNVTITRDLKKGGSITYQVTVPPRAYMHIFTTTVTRIMKFTDRYIEAGGA